MEHLRSRDRQHKANHLIEIQARIPSETVTKMFLDNHDQDRRLLQCYREVWCIAIPQWIEGYEPSHRQFDANMKFLKVVDPPTLVLGTIH